MYTEENHLGISFINGDTALLEYIKKNGQHSGPLVIKSKGRTFDVHVIKTEIDEIQVNDKTYWLRKSEHEALKKVLATENVEGLKEIRFGYVLGLQSPLLNNSTTLVQTSMNGYSVYINFIY